MEWPRRVPWLKQTRVIQNRTTVWLVHVRRLVPNCADNSSRIRKRKLCRCISDMWWCNSAIMSGGQPLSLPSGCVLRLLFSVAQLLQSAHRGSRCKCLRRHFEKEE